MSEVLGLLFAVIVGMTYIPRLFTYSQNASDTTRAVATAQQQQKLISVGSDYIKKYSTNLQSTATATSPAVITVPMLQAVNLLDASFSATNPYGQTWQIQVLQPTAGNLQALFMSFGGTAMNDMTASKIAGFVGQPGGIIPKNDSGIYAGGAGTAIGTFGGWTQATANYNSISGGHLAALLSFNNGQLTSNYLYRNAVPGQPSLNQMGTSIDMAGNNVNNAGTVNATTVNSTTTNATTVNATGAVYSGDWFRTNGNGGWYSQTWGGGWYMSDGTWIRAYNGKNVYTPGAIQADTSVNSGYVSSWGSMNSNGRLRTGEYLQVDGVGNQGWGCSGNLIAKDGAGNIVTCKGGVWTAAGGTAQPFQSPGSSTCDYSVAVAQCPAGSKVLGGGYVLTWFNGSNFSHAPDGSYPDSGNNRWLVVGSGTNQCFQAYANCAY